jgi:formylglycine-generating enzyme required for sulfatase activity
VDGLDSVAGDADRHRCVDALRQAVEEASESAWVVTGRHSTGLDSARLGPGFAEFHAAPGDEAEVAALARTWGLFDTIGNVWEFVEDDRHDS